MGQQALVLRWSFENDKLLKTNTVSFNLPAFESADGFRVCPGAGWCSLLCYARQGRIIIGDAARNREINLAIVRTSLPLFERLAVLDLERIENDSIRLHDSGDFFNQEYLDTWFCIIRRFPQKAFYCYSKSLHLDWSRRPANFERSQSAGGKFDALIDYTQSHTRIFASHADRRAAGYVNGNTNDRPAQRGDLKIGLVYHGTRDLTPKLIQIVRRQA